MTQEVSKTNEELFPLEDARRLEYVNRVRESLVKEIVTEKMKVPGERGDKELLVSLLDGMERTVISKARLKSAEKAADNAADVTGLIANVLKAMPALSSLQHPVVVGRSVPELPNNLEKPELVEGETRVGTQTQNIDQFLKSLPVQEND